MITFEQEIVRYIRAKHRIVHLIKQCQNLEVKRIYNKNRIARVDYREGSLDGKPIQRVIVFLRSKGCLWARERNGGCSMCGHLQGTLMGEELSAKNVITQFNNIFNRIDFKKFPMLCLYNAGSFLCDNEIPLDAQESILKLVSRNRYIKHMIIESRPQFITRQKLQLIDQILSEGENNLKLEIGIGLETSNDIIRDLLINKGFHLEDFLTALDEIKKFKNITVLPYVLLKPPFLTEGEAIMDTVATIRWCAQKKIKTISMEPVSIQNGTLVNFLYRRGLYEVSRLWSVLNVLEQVKNLEIQVRIGGFEFEPNPRAFVRNCYKCTPEILKYIANFNKFQNLDTFKNIPENIQNCSCKSEWKKLINQGSSESIIDRVLKFLS